MLQCFYNITSRYFFLVSSLDKYNIHYRLHDENNTASTMKIERAKVDVDTIYIAQRTLTDLASRILTQKGYNKCSISTNM